MDISHCKHIRIRDNNNYELNVETFVNSLEQKYKLDIRKLPQWNDLIQNLYIVQTEFKRKVQNASFRKTDIIQKLYIQNTRPSPFIMTDNLVRTAKLWRDMENKRKKLKGMKAETDSLSFYKTLSIELAGESSGFKSTVIHPNTETQSNDLLNKKTTDDIVDDQQSTAPQLPVHVCTNQHKLLSPLGSLTSQLSCKFKETSSKSHSEDAENLILKSTSLVNYLPDKIIITDKWVGDKTIKIYLTNNTSEYLYVQYKNILDSYNFANIDVSPKIPTKLYPGLANCFNLRFKLAKNMQDFSTFLYFRIRRNVLSETPEEFLYIPIETAFTVQRSVKVPNTISMPPAYLWQLSFKHGFPNTALKISVNDDFRYNLYIRKRILLLDQMTDNSILSVEVEGPATESILQREDDRIFAGQSTLLSPPVKEVREAETDDMFTSEEVVIMVLDDIVNLSLEPFVFKRTFLRLKPRSKRVTIVYFTKAEHIGYHQSVYDLEFYDPETEELLLTKPVKIYSEVLPYPLQIHPSMLDMTQLLVMHGQCSGNFTITNYNKIYTFDVKIKTTTKMDKIFSITPKETVVVAQSSTMFFLNFCSKSLNTRRRIDDNAYFVIKIVLKNNIPMFKNIPPIFYEIIAPCIAEFQKVYNVTICDEVAE